MAGAEQKPVIDVSICANSREVFDRTEQVIGGIIERYADYIPPSVKALMRRTEATLAVKTFGEKVLAERPKSDASNDLGMTVYATGRGKARLVRNPNSSVNGDSEYRQSRKVTGLLWELRFPKGVFVMSGGAGQFFEVGSERWRTEAGASRGFLMAYDEVVRVEGDHGEIWQNMNYDWDGTPKKPLK